MNLSDLKTSKFLKKEDVGAGVLVTVAGLSQQNVAQEGADPDMKITLHFHELDKPLVLNSTNGQIIAKITGHDSDIEKNWLGARLVLYHDPNVSYAGKLVGGIRVRAPRIPQAPAALSAKLSAPNPVFAQAPTLNQTAAQAAIDESEPLPF